MSTHASFTAINAEAATDAVVLAGAGSLLGECPRWDDDRGRLLWVDLWAGHLHETDPETAATTTTELGPPLSAVVLTRTGTRVVTSGLCILELGPGGPKHLADVPEPACMRINDAAVDAAGRLWLGTMVLPGRPARSGGLWRYQVGETEPKLLVADLALANGIAWSPNGEQMYVVDSLRQQIVVHPFAPESGSVGPGLPFIQVESGDGMPDGIAVDSAGAIWVALAGGAAVRKYDASGTLVDTYPMPVTYPTSCVFGGNDLDELFVTSGSRPHPPAQRAAAVARGAGAVFRIKTGDHGTVSNRMGIEE